MSTNMKRYAETCGRTDAIDGTGFFPEQLPQWAQVWYTLAFLAEDPGNFAARAWMAARLEGVAA